MTQRKILKPSLLPSFFLNELVKEAKPERVGKMEY